MQTKKYSQQHIEIVNEILFDDRQNLDSLSEWIMAGNQLNVGLDVTMESTYRSPLKKGFIIDWKMATVKYDLTGYGKFCECIAQVYNYDTQRVESWTFSMLYIENKPKNAANTLHKPSKGTVN